MAELPNDPWLNGFVNAVVLASVAAWVFILTQWRRHGEVLRFEPRRPVAWDWPAAILAVVFVLMAALGAFAPAGKEASAPQLSPTEIAVQILAAMSPQLLVVGAFFFVIVAIYRATWDDVGLPRSAADAVRDVFTGVLTCLAALLPVHIVQVALLYLAGLQEDPVRHPLVKMVTSSGEPSVMVMVAATIAAVLIAPISEEITFRLLLQGWLEKWDDERRGVPRAADVSIADVFSGAGFDEAGSDEVRMTQDEVSQKAFPYGWLPILISSALFGLAHFGYGPEPIPLFLLAIFLGFVYQRTHRIIPCIVAHSLFNLFTVVILWRMVFHAAE